MKFKIIKKKNKDLIFLITEIGLMVGIGILLNVISTYTVGVWTRASLFPEGWVPSWWIVVCSLVFMRRGGLAAGITAISISTLSYMITSGAVIVVVSPFAFFLDYVSPVVGCLVAGVLCLFTKKKINTYLIFIVVGGGISFIGTFWSGVIFYGQYVPSGWGVYTYSAIYNGLAKLVGVTISAFIFLPFIFSKKKHLFLTKEEPLIKIVRVK